jgi:pyruvate formate lyase activating enzyme
MHEALFYTKLENNTVKCELCPWYCVLKSGQTGVCRVRENKLGTLVTHVYNKVSSIAIDPIEKKPLYHFHPGRKILSIGSVGCNLHCSFCQNHHISQCTASDFKNFSAVTSHELVEKAVVIKDNIGIAYTYNEPFTFYEFMLQTAQVAHKNGLKNVMVSNGYINPEPLKQLLPIIDAFNIDLKAFNNDFYQKQTQGKLEPVLETLKLISKSKAHLEITNLIIPGLNDIADEFERMVCWIASELGNNIPLHLSRFFPHHKLNLPLTSIAKLETLYDLAKRHLHHVYLGNVTDERRSSTYCFHCNKKLISRNHYSISLQNLDKNGCCSKCHCNTGIIV